MTSNSLEHSFSTVRKNHYTQWIKLGDFLPLWSRAKKESLFEQGLYVSLGLQAAKGQIPLFYPKNKERLHLTDFYIPSELKSVKKFIPANCYDIHAIQMLRLNDSLVEYTDLETQTVPFAPEFGADGTITLASAKSKKQSRARSSNRREENRKPGYNGDGLTETLAGGALVLGALDQ